MTAYFARRLLLIPLTFLAITFMVYTTVRVLPGGPVEQAQMQRRLAAMAGEGGGGGLSRDTNLQLDEEALKQLQRYYALDRPIPVGYLQWLGAWPRPFRTRVPEETLLKFKAAFAALQQLREARGKCKDRLEALLSPKSLIVYQDEIYRALTQKEREALQKQDPLFVEHVHQLASAGFAKRDALLALLTSRGYTWGGDGTLHTRVEPSMDPKLIEEAMALIDALRLAREELDSIARTHGYEMDDDGTIYKVEPRMSGICQLDFGTSYTHSESVLRLVASRLPISAQLGLLGYFLTWVVCVPLGIAKAIKHRSAFDTATSLVVFLGYAIPGYVVCMLLLSTAGSRGWLPLGGWLPPGIENMSWGQALVERIRYMAVPVAGYMISSFATMTILMKNSLLENLTADYVRTALAKGLTERRTIWVHAVRNSLIPLTANIGTAASVLLAGSFLIEKVTNVNGMGLLGYNALIQRDYPIVLGILVIVLVIQLLGAVLSDLIWAAIDPRIRFEVRT